MLGFLAYSPVDAFGAVELPQGEFLLLFNTLGVYVDMQVRNISRAHNTIHFSAYICNIF